jgi:hypothetical protein
MIIQKRLKITLATVALALLGIYIYINPKSIETQDSEKIIILCGTKYVWVQRSYPEGFDSGLQTWEQAVDGLLTKLTQKTMTELNRNPLGGLGFMIIESMKPALKDVAIRGLEDTCSGRSTQWLSDLSDELNALSR